MKDEEQIKKDYQARKTTQMSLSSHGHIKDDELGVLLFMKRRNAPRTNEKS